jgi:guanylate kinase
LSNKQQANLYVIAAPSGAGKTSLVKALVQRVPNIKVSVSYTTRKPRPGDREGVDYCFIDTDKFQAMIADNAFLEYAEVHGNYYGTSRAWIEDEIGKGVDVILEIDWQGARQIKNLMCQAVSIFILPPSVATLHERLVRRQQDDDEVIAQRLKAARSEIEHYQEFDYLIVNDHFEEALKDLEAIIRANHLLCAKQVDSRAELINQLLG